MASGVKGKHRAKHLFITLVTILATSASLTAFSPAAAASADVKISSTWQTYTKSSDWHCNARNSLGGISGLAGESCVVVRGNLTQAVLIVRNTTGSSVEIFGGTDLFVNGSISGGATCDFTTLSNGYARACFSPTQSVSCAYQVYGDADLWTNLTGYVTSPWLSPVRQMCQ